MACYLSVIHIRFFNVHNIWLLVVIPWIDYIVLIMLLFPSNLLKFRYADLKNNRLTDYTFSFDKMLSDKVPSCTLISFDLIKNHSLSIWMMITHMIRYAGKYRCLPSVCACSYLFHHPESQQGYWRVENGEPLISFYFEPTTTCPWSRTSSHCW